MKKVVKLLSTISFSILVIIPIFFSSGCSPVSKDDVINNLLPNLWVFLAHIFAAVVLLIACIYLVWNPTKTSLAKRQAYIQNEINQAEEIKNKALKQLAIAEQSKINAFEDAKKIIEDANKQAYQNKVEIEQQAINNSQRVIQQAENDAKKIKTNIEQTMNQQIIDLAFETSNALLKSKVSKKDSQSFVEDFIAKLEKQNPKNKKKGK